MKRNLLFVIALVAFVFNAVAQDGTDMTAATTTFYKTNQDIEVNGYSDDALWGAVDVLDVLNPKPAEASNETDFSATLQVAWKEGVGVYLYLTVIDDVESFWVDGDTYQRDNAEFFFYWGDAGTWGPGTEVTAVDNDTLFNQLRIQLDANYATIHDGRYKGAWAGATLGSAADGNLEAVATATSSGWDIEAIFPFAMFAIKPEIVDDLTFGFAVSLGDADEADRDFQLFLTDDSGQDLAWNNKAYLNTGVLSGTYVNAVENVKVSNVAVYPTLVSDVLNLKGEVSNLSIYNTVGQVVLSIDDVNTSTIDVSGLQSGIYFVEVDGETTKIVKK